MQRFRLWWLIGILMITACSTPTDPSALVNLPLGQNVLSLGPDGQDDCVGPFVSFVTFISLTREGHEWVATSETAEDGDVELRFRATELNGFYVLVEGSIRGAAIDHQGDYISTATMTGSAGGSARFVGAVNVGPRGNNGFYGQIEGHTAITRSVGATDCRTVGFRIRLPGRYDVE